MKNGTLCLGLGSASDWILAVNVVESDIDGNARMDVLVVDSTCNNNPRCCTGNGKTQFTLLSLSIVYV